MEKSVLVIWDDPYHPEETYHKIVYTVFGGRSGGFARHEVRGICCAAKHRIWQCAFLWAVYRGTQTFP